MKPSKRMLVGLFVAVACGGQKPGSTEPGGDRERSNEATESSAHGASTGANDDTGVLRLGHYSTGDGLAGLTLDRSGSTPKMKVDGETDIIELTPRPGWKRGITVLKDPRGDIRLEIDEHGGVLLIGTGRPQRVYLDGVPDKLAAATVTGQAPPEEVSPAEQHRT
ncbi:MAG: DUF4908 domain-containing protein, partial [Deltaproteobacteria bacterium]|nr:DUF4908 domain-containing protein [Deltaproteobacteria bacterium]